MKKIKITYDDGKQCYSYKMDESEIEEERELLKEWQTNGANPWLEGVPFEHLWRTIAFLHKDIGQFNVRDGDKAHGIFGWDESFWQSHNCPGIGFNEDKLKVTVAWLYY